MAQPKEVHDLKDEEESTTKDVQHIMTHVFQACEAKGRIGYFHFLVDPKSFAHTVENMFHFAFLIKDGRVGVTMGKDGIPYIYLRKRLLLGLGVWSVGVVCCIHAASSKTEHGQSTKTEKHQVIVSLTIEDWKVQIILHCNKTNTQSLSSYRRPLPSSTLLKPASHHERMNNN